MTERRSGGLEHHTAFKGGPSDERSVAGSGALQRQRGGL